MSKYHEPVKETRGPILEADKDEKCSDSEDEDSE